MHALGTAGATSHDAGQCAVLVAGAGVLQDAHGLGAGALRDIRWAGAGVALWGAHAATGTLHLGLGLVALAGRLLVVALAGSRRRRRGRRGRWGRRGARLARNDGVGRLALDATLTRTWLATLQLHVALFSPSGSPAVPRKRGFRAVQELYNATNPCVPLSLPAGCLDISNRSQGASPASSPCRPQFRSPRPAHRGPKRCRRSC